MKSTTQNVQSEIVLYQSRQKDVSVEVQVAKDSVWLTQAQISQLFQTDRTSITKHINNIVKSGELAEKSNVRFLHIAHSDRPVKFYNLDFIISVGYRVNSKTATEFRKWATGVLSDHILKGYTLNQSRLEQKRGEELKELEQAIGLLQTTVAQKYLNRDEAVGLLEVIADYADSWLLLHQYDQGEFATAKLTRRVPFTLKPQAAYEAVEELAHNLRRKQEASSFFGKERQKEALAGILGNVEQSFGGQVLYPSLEEKAAHLLYFIIKDHPFVDGNKRIGSFLFIVYLARNKFLFNEQGEKKINDNALVALALLVAESKPAQKDVIIKLILNLLKKK